jgi:uncharacterized protein (TIGR04141 family)
MDRLRDRIEDSSTFFHDGRWFAVAHDYESQVRTEAARILAHKSTLTMPAWPKKHDEKDYNDLVTRNDRRYFALDRKLIRTAVHPRGIEHCDLLGPDDEFIHVKRLRGSDDAGHLFGGWPAPAAVSASPALPSCGTRRPGLYG